MDLRALLLVWIALSPALVAGEAAKAGEEVFRRHLAAGAKSLALGTKEGQANALAEFKEARKLRPESAEAHYWIGLTYSDYQNFAEAAAYADQAVALDSRYAPAWLLWGQCLLYQHEWKEAKEKLEQAHRLDPQNPLVVFNRARCLFHGFDNRADALELFKEALRLEPLQPSAAIAPVFVQVRIYIGCCYLDKDMPAASIAFREALRRDPRNAEARVRYAVAVRKDGRPDTAEKELKLVLERNPRHVEALLQLGHLYATDLPDREQARLILERFLEAAPADHPQLEPARAWLAGAAPGPAPKVDPPAPGRAPLPVPGASRAPAPPIPPKKKESSR